MECFGFLLLVDKKLTLMQEMLSLVIFLSLRHFLFDVLDLNEKKQKLQGSGWIVVVARCLRLEDESGMFNLPLLRSNNKYHCLH